MTELCELAFKYKTDKCPQLNHMFTPFYHSLLKDKRQSIKKVLEIGVGDNTIKKWFPEYKPGGSLRMWRDYFPNAQIYGADIAPECIFEEERIKTYLCDERKKEDILQLIEQTGTDIDLVIDDAVHHMKEQEFLCRTLLPLLKKDVIYVIEDASSPEKLVENLSEYNCFIPKLPPKKMKSGDRLVVIRRQDELSTN